MKLRLSRRTSTREEAVVELAAEEDAGDDDVRISLDEARAFYREHADEIVARMRKPIAHSDNAAALIVAQCETDPRLRKEALKAVESARRVTN